MRKHVLVAFLLLLAGPGCRRPPARVSAKNDPRVPLWYRDGGERCCWHVGAAKDPRKQKALEEFAAELKKKSSGRRWTADVVSRIKGFLRDDDEMVVLQAALYCGYRDPDFLPELEAAHRRWPENAQVERIFVKTAANWWSDEKLRRYFWALPADTPRNGETYQALHRELARCGTLADARKLEEQLPAGADRRHDPVIARIRLHRSERPDKLAFRILEFLDRNPMGRVHQHGWGAQSNRCCWPAHLYRCELLRYLTFGRDPRYRRYIKEGVARRLFFCSDQETYPDGIKDMLNAWLKKNPKR